MTVVATAGHVDHGKSSLVLALTGTDPDRFEEEKRRGLTIDLGFAHTVLPSGAELSFIDVPGHVKFLRNMLAGVGGVNACIFVVAATEGWKPQSEEHLRILELLGVEFGLVALTKVDLVDDDLLELAQMDVADHVEGTFLDGAPVIPVAATEGRGVDEMRHAIDELILRSGEAADRGRPRLWIDRVFAAKGSGTVATGTLVGGSFAADQTVHIAPGGHDVRIRSIQTAGSTVERIGPGNRVAVNLSGVDHHDLSRGDAVVESDRWHLTDRLDASLDVLASLDHEVSRRGAYVAYIGAGEHPVKMRVLGTEALSPGTTGAVRLFLPDPLPLLPGDRFILRESGRDETVGGGEILDIEPVIRASRAAPDRTIERVIRERGWVTAGELERLTGEVVEPTLGEWVTTPEAVAATLESVLERVTGAGVTGVDLAAFDDRERAAIDTTDELVVDAGLVLPADAVDPYVDHPFLTELLDGGFTPPSADDVDRNDMRELARRGHIVQRDGVVFHTETIEEAGRVAARLLLEHPDGFTVAQFRDVTGASRKFVLPLVSELDKRGVTRRREDVRIAGARLPSV
ncbi:MAG: selenocysteine-specific translation elongation factor [Ilumatobacter sp.]|uniref:selenocysteine-specific translation elongation factor n=1 Tax=Ilumatobacter sp. TaxID=1967498 RepID=UPI003C793445